MKKSIIIFVTLLTTLSLTAFGFINCNDSVTGKVETSSNKIVAVDQQVAEVINDRVLSDFSFDIGTIIGPINKGDLDFFFDFGTRFSAIKKGDLDKSRSILDFLPKDQTQRVVLYKSVDIIIIKDDKQSDIIETGKGGVLTAAQIELLQSSDYSTNIKIRADYLEKNKVTGQLDNSYSTPHLTIVPEKQAVYISGKEALIKYLRENSKENTAIVQKDNLIPAKLYFTVTKKGTISNIKIPRSSGYPSLDKKIIELITKAPGKWEPAENSKGEKVDQELVISFGMVGC